MLKNYFTVILRGFRRNKGFALINILGFTLGIAAGLIIFLLVSHELSFDGFHQHKDRIYRVVSTETGASGTNHSAITPYPLGDALRNDFTHFDRVSQIHYEEELMVNVDGDNFVEPNILFADSSFFELFSFPVISGNPKKMLGQPGFVFLTQSLANKYFPGEDPQGKKLTFKDLLGLELAVAGVVEDPPLNSHIQFSMVISFPSFNLDHIGFPIDTWTLMSSGFSYVLLAEDVNPQDTESEFEKMVEKYKDEDDRNKSTYQLQALSTIHFDTKYNGTIISPTDKRFLWALGLVGFFILAIGCVNFINLSTALAVKKSKEVGVRKTMGADRRQLMQQYLSETFLITLISALLALGLTERMLPLFNQWFGKSITLNLLSDLRPLMFLLVLVIIVSVASGLYPAFVLSRFNPVKALKSAFKRQDRSSLSVRRGLVVFQFCISQILVICTIIVFSQMQYFRNKPLGFTRDGVINLPLPENNREILESFQLRMEGVAAVQNISFSLGAPIADNDIGTGFWLAENGVAARFGCDIKPVDYHYLETYGLKLKHGQWFDRNEERSAWPDSGKMHRKDYQYRFVVNEKAISTLGFSDPEKALGKDITIGIHEITGPIIGVVNDFHHYSLHQAIEPTVIMHFPYFYFNAGVSMSMEDPAATLAAIKEIWTDLYPDRFFEYEFMDDELEALYEGEQRTFSLLQLFSGISIFIGCLGLLGLISFIVSQKTKEVGIRKVFGAGVTSIVMLFSREFLVLVAVAFLVAAPLAWFSMEQWLSDFAYRIDIQWWVFVAGVLLTMFIAFCTVGYQSMKAALANPIDALRSE